MKLSEEYSIKVAALQSAEHQLTVDLSKRITPDIWLDVLIYFEHNLEQSSVAALYDALFEKGTDFAANVYLNDEDYTFFIDKIRAILERYATINPQAWVELGLQHVLCRRHAVEKEKASLYLNRGMEAGVKWARPLYLYYNYLGVLADIDRETAKAELETLALGGDLYATAYIAHIDVWTDKFEEVFDRIQVLRHAQEKKLLRHYYEVLQFYYARKDNKAKRLEILEEGIALTDSRYCRFVLNDIKRADATSSVELERLIPEYHELFEYGMMDAAVQIALIKLQGLSNDNQVKEDFEQPLWYLQKAYDYNNIYAGYRLACLYLYNDTLQDIERGLSLLQLLDQRDDYVEAQVELAEILLEGRFLPRDEKSAFQKFSALAQKNIAYAKLRMGNMIESGYDGIDPDYKVAFAYYQDAAKDKLPQALYQVGRYLKYGIHGEEPDLAAAIPYFEEAAASNNVTALTEMGLASELKAEPDYKLAFDYFSRAADLGYPYAYYLKGIYLENDYHQTGAPQPAAAFAAFETGASMQDLNSIYELARCYRGGIGTEINLDRMIDLYQQAAERNHVQALTDLALCYEYGYGLSKDAFKAQEYIKKAADLGFPYAIYVMGRYYLTGLVKQDVPLGLQLLEEAAQKNVGEALLLLGDYFFFDYDQREEYDTGFDYYTRAEKLGYLTDGLGMCYEFGIGIEAQPAKAFEYYKQAAERGNQEAIYRLGRCLYFGIGTEIDKTAAYSQFIEVAQQGNIYACYFVGLQLLDGEGVPTDLHDGIEWLMKAADADHADAQYKLANCYLMGDGVEENETLALEWFERAADNGHEEAIRLTKKTRK
ncbi:MULTISPECIES: tetratricopeptide repeat protein [unclassified Sphingobacterium]|uniref:tetratricopeptide repeat protein n=1 Tax=unclassified Sphingobacterium TaxID=2609468 RepID=UPI0025F83A8C|nr:MULTISPECIES: tetratricopeptide repeat protein [unclassified Sphingobacterium]